MLSDPELLWCCCSEPALEVTVEEDVEEERVFSLKSVMMTVTLPTVTASCCAVLLSTFFSRGLDVWFDSLVLVVAFADCMLFASLGGSFRTSDFGFVFLLVFFLVTLGLISLSFSGFSLSCFSTFSFFSFFGGGGVAYCCATCCATS